MFVAHVPIGLLALLAGTRLLPRPEPESRPFDGVAAALNADNGVQDARSRLMDSAGKTRDMRRDFQRRIRRDPEFLAGDYTIKWLEAWLEKNAE